MLSEGKDDSDKKDEWKWCRILAGVFFSFISGLFEVAINTIVKGMKVDFDDVLFVTSIAQMVLAVAVNLKEGTSMWISNVDEDKSKCKIWISMIGFAIARGIFFLTDLTAASFMDLGDAMTIILSSVVPTTIFAAIFLKERFKLNKILGKRLKDQKIVIIIIKWIKN